MQTKPLGIGDIASTEMGTGARFNTGKLPVELLPLRDLYALYRKAIGSATPEIECLRHLAAFQEGKDNALHDAMLALGKPTDVMKAATEVFDYGRKKYAEWNWAKGMVWSAVIGCATRHLIQMIDGEAVDLVENGGSGLPHLGHVMCNLLMLSTYRRVYPVGDDRPQYLRYVPVNTVHDVIHDGEE